MPHPPSQSHMDTMTATVKLCRWDDVTSSMKTVNSRTGLCEYPAGTELCGCHCHHSRVMWILPLSLRYIKTMTCFAVTGLPCPSLSQSGNITMGHSVTITTSICMTKVAATPLLTKIHRYRHHQHRSYADFTSSCRLMRYPMTTLADAWMLTMSTAEYPDAVP